MERSHAAVLGALAAGAVVGLGLLLLREDPSRGGKAGQGGLPATKATPSPGASVGGLAPGPAGPGPVVPGKSSGRASLAISGFVRDTRGKPVAGARVSPVADEARAVTTGTDGAFRLELLPAESERKLALLARGPAPLAPRVVPGVAPGSSIVIVLRAGDGALLGRVVRADPSRRPVPGARLEATVGDWLARATSDQDGRFRLEGAPAGAIGVLASADGLVPRVATLQAARGASPEQEIALEPGVRLAGQVVRDGRPVAGATVLMRETNVPLPFERRTTRSDASGSFAFDALPACEALVHARSSDGISPVKVVRSTGARDPEPVTLELGPGGAVFGRVVCGGNAVAGATLALREPGEEAERRATSGPDGRFRIEPVAAGAISLRVEAPGFATRRVNIGAGADQEIVLARAAVLVVSVAARDARAEARGSTGDLHLLRPLGEKNGRLELVADDLAPGTAWVVARAEGRAPAAAKVELTEGAQARLELDLAAGKPIEGRCVGDDGLPLGGASVVAIDPASGPLAANAAAVADEDGRFSIAAAPPGRLHLVASVAGYVDGQLDVDAGTTGLSIELARAYALEVQLTAASGIDRAFVTLTPLEGKGERLEQAVVGEGTSASAVFQQVFGERYRVEALVPGLAPARQDVDPRTGASVQLSLGAGARAAGVVLAPDGTPLPGAAIIRGSNPNEELDHEGAFATLLEMTEAEGAFACTIAPEGEDVVVSHPRYAPLLTHLAPGEGQKLQLAEGARLSGRTLGPDGGPRPGIGVAIDGPVSKHGASGADGSFLFTGLLPGRYHVRRHDSAPEAPPVEVTVGARGEVSVDLKQP